MPKKTRYTNFLLNQRNWAFTNEIMYFSDVFTMNHEKKASYFSD